MKESELGSLVMVHPEDMNLADAKAMAAEHGATIVANRFIPRGMAILARADSQTLPEQKTIWR